MATKLFEMRIKAGELLGIIESLNTQYHKECMEILQALMNAVFAHFTTGKVQSVSFVPCKEKDGEATSNNIQALVEGIMKVENSGIDTPNDKGSGQEEVDDYEADPEYIPVGGYSRLHAVKRRGRQSTPRAAKRRKPSTPRHLTPVAAAETESEDNADEEDEEADPEEADIPDEPMDDLPDNDNDSDINQDADGDDGIPEDAVIEDSDEQPPVPLPGQTFDCVVCPDESRFTTNVELDLLNHVQEKHMEGMTDNSEFATINCQLCEKVFKHRKNMKTSWVSLLWHRHAKHGIQLPWYVNILSCPYCRRFKCCTNNALAQHMKVVHGAKTKKGRVLCSSCNLLLKPSSLKVHMKLCKAFGTEGGNYTGGGYWCGLCKSGDSEPFKGETLADLVNHVKDEHVSWKRGRKKLRKASLRCDQCPKSLICRSTIKELYYHIMWHRSERHSSQLPRYIKVITCPQCGTYSCVTKKDLKDHMRHVHSNVTRINCAICQASIKPCSLKVHMKSCHSEKTKKKKSKAEGDNHVYSCEFCARSPQPFTGEDYEDLVSHVKVKHMVFKTNRANCRAASLNCDICAKVLICRSTLKNLYESILWHRSEKHSVTLPTYVKVIRCSQCNNYACISPKDMRTHERQVHHMERMPCPLCGAMIKPSSMKTHMESRHPTERKTVSCAQCGKEYIGEANLRKHIDRMHMGNKSYLCEICCKQFYERDEMYKHMFHKHKMNPLNKKTFKCDQCDYEALSVKDVEHHGTVHSSKREFCCELCGKEFKRRGSLTTHRIIMHSDGMTRFSCEECGFTTHVKQYLIRHRVIHSQEKKHVCSICGYATHFQENLRKHEKNKHGRSFGKRQRRSNPATTNVVPQQQLGQFVAPHNEAPVVTNVNAGSTVHVVQILPRPEPESNPRQQATYSPHNSRELPSDLYRPQGDFRTIQPNPAISSTLSLPVSTEQSTTTLPNMPYFQYPVATMAPVFPTPVITSNTGVITHLPHTQNDVQGTVHDLSVANSGQAGQQYEYHIPNPYTLVYHDDHTNINKQQ